MTATKRGSTRIAPEYSIFELAILSRVSQPLLISLENLIISRGIVVNLKSYKLLSADETLTRILNELNIEIDSEDIEIL